MPMPTEGAWPPPQHQPAYQAYRDWDAWYVGNADKLRDVYQGRGATGYSLPPSQRRYPGQQAGGIVGRFSRWLWGAPTSISERDGRLHVPLPADLSATAANLLFSEPPKLTCADTRVSARLERLVEDGLHPLLLHAAEANSALGDVYLRPTIDRDVFPDRAFLTTVHADGALPVIRWGRLAEVTFWSEQHVDGQTVFRLLEHHDVVRDAAGAGTGRITYALYEGNGAQLGRRIDLGAFDSTRGLRDLVDSDGSQATGLSRLDVVRVPNAGPQRLWRTQANLKYHGRSDYDGNEPIFDRIDEVWTSWMRDIRLARGRITVPDYMLDSSGPGQGATFNPDREVYVGMRMAPNQEGATGITVSQFAIRHAEHKATIDALVETALRHAGLSSQTMGEEGDTAVTATEIQARERQSFTTRGVRIETWRPAVGDAVMLLLELEASTFNGPAPVRPDIEFGDSVSESPETKARTLQLLHAAEAISTETKVRRLNPDWTEPQIAAEVRRIQGATAATPEDSLGSLAGNDPPSAGGQQPEEA